MAETTLNGLVVATDVTFEEYLDKYAADFCEYVGGVVVKMNPVTLRHYQLVSFLQTLFATYFEQQPIGIVVGEPFVLKLPDVGHGREPDLQIILDESRSRLHDTYMEGPADICIEVVSPESISRDHGEKFQEYELGGVAEYWIIDHVHTECRFYRLGSDGRYVRQSENSEGNYETPRLPRFRLHVPTLWQENLPTPSTIVRMVDEMLA